MRKKTKFIALRVSILVAFAILAGRLWYVQVVMGSYYKTQADTSKIRILPVDANRGIIYDQVGRQLVWNAPSWTVAVVPHGIPSGSQGRQIFQTLSRLLHGEPSARAIASIVTANAWRPYALVPVKQRVSSDTAMVVRQLHMQLPGVRAESTSIRSYRSDYAQNQFPLAHILGYASQIDEAGYASSVRAYPKEHFSQTDTIGRMGIEASLDPYLHGINGTKQVEVDAGERPIRVLHNGGTTPGDSVYLTIDWQLQKQVTRDLAAALNHVGLRKGIAILEDVRTGRIRAMVSLPAFNNNWFSGGISTKEYQQLITDPAFPMNDYAIAGQFPPGSTFKVVTAAAALETGAASPGRVINDTGLIKLCSQYDPSSCQNFYGWNPAGLGPMNIVTALAQSSDIYFYTVAGGNPNSSSTWPAIGSDRLARYARLLGLGETTGIELPGEMPGLVPSRTWFAHLKPGVFKNPGEVWHIGDTYNMAIGQGKNLATPLQMVNVTATIANGGTLLRPRIVDHIAGSVIPRRGRLPHTQVIQPFVPSIVRRNFINPYYLSLIQQGMHASVQPFPIGTSYNVVDKRMDAAGKTGTAEDKLPDGTNAADAWWMGYAPYNNPQVAVIVLAPNASSEGAITAAPIARKLLQDYFHLKPSTSNWLTDVQRSLAGSAGGAQ